MYSAASVVIAFDGLAALLEVLVEVALQGVAAQAADRLGDQGVQVGDDAGDVGVLGDRETVSHGILLVSAVWSHPTTATAGRFAARPGRSAAGQTASRKATVCATYQGSSAPRSWKPT